MSAAPRDPLAPPRSSGYLRAIVLAILVHAVLIAALTLGLDWTHTNPEQPQIEAELWAQAPENAAPGAAAALPVPQPAPEPEPVLQEPEPEPEPEPPEPEPVPEPVPEPEPQGPSEADIALEREKEIQRLQAEKEHLLQLERERQAKEKQERERQLAQEKAEKERLEKEKQQLEAKRKEQQKRQAAIREAENRRAEELRQEQLRRMSQLAAGGGQPGGGGGSGTAPSENYAGRIRARVLPNITYTYTGSDNPHAIAEVRTAPDGTIVGVRIAGPSGNPAWDEAVVRALHKTGVLPRDIDGRVPSHLIIGFRPKD